MFEHGVFVILLRLQHYDYEIANLWFSTNKSWKIVSSN